MQNSKELGVQDPPTVNILNNTTGLRLKVWPLTGQQTYFLLDQNDASLGNHTEVRRVRTLLMLGGYSGSLIRRMGGSVTNLPRQGLSLPGCF